ncbi:MAG TPA: prepilin-type N-terminal cleavage/methylation domain-containing protein [Gallionella sp.]|nr:prepilin-type N-terminal cleavage/methylation domain-containing protein [Gallionella sp.]
MSYIHSYICRGFSLVEMAMVLLIVALLLGSLLPTLSNQVEQQHMSETRKQLDEIQQALIGFTVINGRLPCPADGTIATGQANAGMEATIGSGSAMTCANIANNAAGGVLPWATLGISETDAWGRRFTYRVTAVFADAISANTYGYDNNTTYGCVSTHICTPPISPQYASFALCSCGGLNILSAATGSNIATNVPVVVVSHGTNGLGAYTTSGQQLPGAAGDEGENADNDNIFVSHDFAPTFDDLVTWVSPSILFNRMVGAGKLP